MLYLPALLLFLATLGAAQTVTTYSTLSTYSAATTGATFIGFDNILPSGTPYQGFNPLSVLGVSFTTATSFNVNTADYYSGADYPGDYLLSTGDDTNGSSTLVITLPTPTLALALDYGQLFGGHTATITLSNGFTFNAASPGVGATAFAGFVSATPITGLTYTVGGSDYWILEDLRIGAPAPVNGSAAPVLTLSLASPLVPAGHSTTLDWTSSNAGACTAYGSWTGSVATSGTLVVTAPATPGYYTYSLVCSGAGGRATQSAVLTASGATPSPSITFTTASLDLPPPNEIVALTTTLTVPPPPPDPSNTAASLFVWPGLEPNGNSANFLPINNGVLQSVLSWGPSCAPTTQPTPFSSWWISAQYVNTNSTDPDFAGCYSGSSLLVAPGDQLAIGMSLDQSSNLWSETITDSTTRQTVTFSMNLQGQGQNFLLFVIESYFGSAIYTPVTFSNTTVTFHSPDYTGVCLPSQGAGNSYVITPPTSQNSGTQCFIDAIVLTQPVTPASLSITSSHTGSFTQAQEGAAYTIAVSNAASVGQTAGAVTVTENLPAGLTLTSMSGPGWMCSANTCKRSGALSSGSFYPPITAAVNVSLTAAPQLANQVTVMGGGSVAASGSDSTTIAASPCDVSAAVTNVAALLAIVNEALGAAQPANDLSIDGEVNVVDVQLVMNAALGLGCSASPRL